MDSAARLRSIDCLTMIEQRLPALSGASRRVAEAIVADPWAILGMTIYDVAAASGVSLPSVTRFCRAVGYPGFRELVQGIAQSLGRIESKDLEMLEAPSTGNGLATLAGQIVRRQVDALQTTLKTLDYDAIERATAAIAASSRVTIIGHGGAYVPSLGIAVKLNWAGIAAFPATPDLFTNQVIAVDKGDVVIAVSHQGRTRDAIDSLSMAKAFGATTIAITAVPQSPLASVADIAVAVLTPEVARAGTFLIAFDTIMLMADVLSAAVSDRKWGGTPPHRAEMVEWIETNLRVGPLPQPQSRPRQKAESGNEQTEADGAKPGSDKAGKKRRRQTKS